ncbi:MAG: hypothetical protein A2X36_07240 [Elusimicrobia bacterium GWA2_69_24]|nr:MAG: hypothetical protein A2X36_07240 [Elusimicrobia bacterium GWA2_69_24]HBL16168.1 hypothetical protein [Elusimicrobiota bacterium]
MKKLPIPFLAPVLWGFFATNLWAGAHIVIPAPTQVPMQIIPLVPTHIINNTPLPFPMPVIELPKAAMYPLGIPTLPGQPVYRLPSVAVTLTAAAPAVKAATPVRAAAAAVNAQTSTFSKASASLSQKGEKLPSAERLQDMFDGSAENDAESESEPVWAGSESTPQTLPEEDLLREMGL